MNLSHSTSGLRAVGAVRARLISIDVSKGHFWTIEKSEGRLPMTTIPVWVSTPVVGLRFWWDSAERFAEAGVTRSCRMGGREYRTDTRGDHEADRHKSHRGEFLAEDQEAGCRRDRRREAHQD